MRPFGALAGEVLFPAGDGHSGLAPWKSDGSAAGTLALADPLPPGSTISPHQFTDFGDVALFAGPGSPSSWWRSGGPTAPRPAPSAWPSPASPGGGRPSFTRLGDRVLFVQQSGLRVTDGTVGGTTVLLPSSFAAFLTPLPAPPALPSGKVLFRAVQRPGWDWSCGRATAPSRGRNWSRI